MEVSKKRDLDQKYTSTQTNPFTPQRKLPRLGKYKKTWAQKRKIDENVSRMSKRGGVLMQGRSDIKTASGFNDQRRAETALQSSDGESGRKPA